ncbi:four-helix bundle copper-binding protein [Thermoplasmatales archaeon SW_10_69_26]|nr:MAG: four-helix bundle copper-binding protein [Thermoplasmatales archaeon SW_10_69_26]
MALTELQMGSEIESCLDNCFEASQAAEKCANHCIEMGEADRSRCIELCQDVADLTSLHARMMARDSEYHNEMAAVCADLCETCADECEQFDGPIPQTCAQACRTCAASCRQMAGA